MSAWKRITATSPERGRRVLVTNNLDATDAHGDRSHVWIGFVHDGERMGDFGAFDDCSNRVRGLTHWAPLP